MRDRDPPEDTASLPEDVADEAERLTRQAREAVEEPERAAATERRDELLATHGYAARIREGAVLVLYPTDWIDEEGIVRTDRIDDVSRAVERHLEAPGSADDWDRVEEHNRAIVDVVTEKHGPVHGANAEAFADFMGNHYARPLETATPRMREEFLTEYFPRNSWPSEEQRALVEESLELVLAETQS